MKNLNYKFSFIIVALLVLLSGNIQELRADGGKAGRPQQHPSYEEIQMQKIAFFTQELELTPEEAQKFWPVYNAASKKTQAAKKQINICLKNLHNALKAETPASDAEIKNLMGSYFKACEEEIAIQSKNFEEISKVLPVDKAAKTFSLEERFRIMLIRHLRK